MCSESELNTKCCPQTVIGEVNIERALKWAQEQQAETVVVLTHRLEQSVITAATEGLQRHNETNKTQTRWVILARAVLVWVFSFFSL